MAARSTVPSAVRSRSPKRAIASSTPSPGTSSTAREWASRSITRSPASRQIWATVDLPEPMPPVRPRRSGGTVADMPRWYVRKRHHETVPQVTPAPYGAGLDPRDLRITRAARRAVAGGGGFGLGVAAAAVASRLNFDAVGFAVIGIAAGLGGGIVRDLILGIGVPAAFADPWYLTCARSGAGFSF